MTLNEARRFAEVVTEVYAGVETANRVARDMNRHFPKYIWWVKQAGERWTIEVEPRRRSRKVIGDPPARPQMPPNRVITEGREPVPPTTK